MLDTLLNLLLMELYIRDTLLAKSSLNLMRIYQYVVLEVKGYLTISTGIYMTTKSLQLFKQEIFNSGGKC